MDFDWNNAKAFIYTAEAGSLSLAAKKMGVSQPTMGRQVAALEESLNLPLFERTKNKLLLTPKGRIIFEQLKQMQTLASETTLKAEGLSHNIQGSVTLSVNQLDAIYRIPSFISKFRQEQPSIQVQLNVSNLKSDLLEREADIAIRNVRPSEENLIARKLKTESIFFYGTPKLLSKYDTENDKALSNIQVIGFEDSAYFISYLDEKGWAIADKNIAIKSDFQPFHIEMAKQGLGVAVLPQSIGDSIPELAQAFKNLGSVFELELWLVCHQELRSSRKIRYLFDFISRELGEK
ncbi:LysR family transcriptional regulator [Paraglaciecola sp.]|uniref:LysR family transcriptional regulator n=1 Tax=Paraglaciecola sp. TaxID=1920173 RepID=UPI003264007C